MAPIMHKVDPEGDLVVVLKEPNTKNVFPEVSLRQEVNLGKDAPTFAPDTTDVKVPLMFSGLPNNAATAEAPEEVRFLVSSRHLTMASHMFKTMLSQRWTQPEAANAQSDSTDADAATSTIAPVETSSLSDGTDSPAPSVTSRISPTKEVVIREWHAYALLTVFNVIHGKGSRVPRRINLEFFAQVAAIAHYLQCTEALSVITDLWHSLNYKRPDKYGKEAIMWLSISWVFSWSPMFIKAARLIVQAGEGLDRVITHDLPLFKILDKLDEKRKNALGDIADKLRTVDRQLRRGEIGCNNTCRATMLGSLVTEKQKNRELSALYCHLDHNAASLSRIITAVEEFVPIVWYDSSGCAHPCDAKGLILPLIRTIERDLGLLKFSDFKREP